MSSEKQVDNTTRNIILAVVFVLLLLAVWYYMSSNTPVTSATPATPAPTPVMVWTKTPSNFVVGGGANIPNYPEVKFGICRFSFSKDGIVGKNTGVYVDGKCMSINNDQEADYEILDNNNNYEYITGTGDVVVAEATIPSEMIDTIRQEGITLDGNVAKLYGCQRKIVEGPNYYAIPGVMIGDKCRTPPSLLDRARETDLNKITTLQLKRKI
jgi:hypothetical protein